MTKNQKQARLERAKRHAEQDTLRAGAYGVIKEGAFKGCSVGCDAWEICACSFDDFYNLDHHEIVAAHDGTAVWLEYLRDTIFECLEEKHRAWWHVELAKALSETPEDMDWEVLKHIVSITILRSNLGGIRKGDRHFKELANLIEMAISYHQNPTETGRRDAEDDMASCCPRFSHHAIYPIRESVSECVDAVAGSVMRRLDGMIHKGVADRIIETIRS
jgi:hypothetical protein